MSPASPTTADPAELHERIRALEVENRQLRAAARSYRRLFEDNPEPMLIYNTATMSIRAVNDAALLQYGHSRAEFLNLSFNDIHQPEDTFPSDVSLPRAGIWHHLRKDGSVFPVQITLHEIPFEDQPARLVAAEDITARLQTETQLREAREELEKRVAERTAELALANEKLTAEIAERTLVELTLRRHNELLDMASDAVLIWDFDGRIRYWNRSAERLYGFSPEDAQGRIHHELLATVHPAGLEDFKAALAKEGRWSGELIHVTKSGHKVIVESHQQLVEQPDGTQRVLETNHDITERVLLHDEIVAASERERERFGQDLHDGLCQVLTAARLKADSLAARLARQEPPDINQVKTIANILAQATDEARNLARGLEPVARLPEGLMSALLQLAESTRRIFGVECVCEFTLPVLMSNHKAATELFRIAQEATNNALKHSHARHITLHLAQKAGDAILTITSDGKPFPKRPRNTGMGLKTMHFRASRIGASLCIEPSPNGGTRVRCELSNPDDQPSASRGALSTGAQQRALSVLWSESFTTPGPDTFPCPPTP